MGSLISEIRRKNYKISEIRGKYFKNSENFIVIRRDFVLRIVKITFCN